MPVIAENDIVLDTPKVPKGIIAPADIQFETKGNVSPQDIQFDAKAGNISPQAIDFSFGGGGKPAGGVTGDFSTGIWPSIKQGAKESIVGMLATQKPPQPSEGNFIENIARGLTITVADLPVTIAGFVAGGFPGAFGLPAGVRKVITDKYQKGDIKGAGDLLDRFGGAAWETAKGELTGAATGKIGEMVSGIAKLPAQVGTATVAGAGLEGRIPTPQELAQNAVIMGALGGAGKGIEALRSTPQIPIRGTAKIAQPKGVSNEIQKVQETPQVTPEGWGKGRHDNIITNGKWDIEAIRDQTGKIQYRVKNNDTLQYLTGQGNDIYFPDVVTAKKATEAPVKAPEMPQATPSMPKAEIVPQNEAVQSVKPPIEEPLPKYAGSINLQRQAITPEAKQVEIQMAEQLPGSTRTWAQVWQEAKPMVDNIAPVMEKAKSGSPLTDSESMALRTVNAKQVQNLKDNTSNMTQDEFNSVYNNLRDNEFAMASQDATQSGRKLSQFRMVIGPDGPVSTKMQMNPWQAIQNAMNKLKRPLNERERKELDNVDLENPASVKNFVGRLGNPKAREYFWNYYYNNLMSGIPTHIVNTFSNTLFTAYQIPHRVLTGAIDASISKLTGRPRQVYISEIVPMMAGYKQGFVPGAKAAGSTFWNGTTVHDNLSKWELDIGSANEAFSRSPNKYVRSKPVVLATTGFLRAMSAMDVWSKTMASEAQSKALALRTGKQKGLQGAELDKYVKQTLEAFPDELKPLVRDFAKTSVFTDDPGKFTKWIIQGRKILPFESGRFVIPFVSTVSNLVQRGMEFTPGIGLIQEGYNKATGQKTLPSNELIAKQIEGAIITLYIMHKISAGDITGPIPQNPNEKEGFYREGKLPWAIKVGNSWVQYNRMFQPFSMPVSAVTSAYNAIKESKKDEDVAGVFANAAAGFAGAIMDNSYLQGVTNLLDRYGSRRGMAQRMGASLVPYSSFWRSVNHAYEAATEGTAKIRPSNDWLGAFAQVIPGLSKIIPAKLTLWGDEIDYPGGVLRQWLPLKWQSENLDPVETELERLGVYPGQPGQNIAIGGKPVKLPDDLYRDYCISFGARAKKILDIVIAQPGWQGYANDEIKVKQIEHVMDSLRSQELQKAKAEYMKKKEQETQ